MGFTDMLELQLVQVKNPFDRKKREVTTLAFKRQSLQQLYDELVPKDIDVVISVNGQPVEKQFWPTTIPRVGDQIVVMPVVSGGGDDKAILGAILTIALVWAAPGISALAIGRGWEAGMIAGFGGLSLMHAVAGVGVMLAGGMLINSIMPKPSLKSPDFDGDYTQTYSWNPVTLQKQGIVIPRFYGRNKLYGNVIAVNAEPDATDETKQNLNIVLSLCQGPIQSISNIQINDQPVENYDNVIVDTKLGLLDQTVISFNGSDMICKPDYRPNRIVTNAGGPVEYTTPDNDYDDLEIDIVFPRGVYYANNQGGLSNHSIGIKIEIKEVGGVYSTLVDTTVTNNTTSAVWKTYKASETYAGGVPVTITDGKRYVIRVTKTTTDKGVRYGDEVRLGGVREVINTKFTYPGRALLGVSALATEQLSGSLNVSCIVEGKVVRIYDGSTWSIGYTTNPAWVLYDILTQPVISGDGSGGNPWTVERYDGIDPSRIDTEAFWELAQFCDELVPDGEGGTEKRITFNGGFDTGTTMWEAALKVCEVARCGLVWNGVELTVAIDKRVANPVQMFTVGNIIKDTFKETFLPQEDRAGEIEIHYRDALQDYQRVPFTIFDSEAGHSTKKVTLELFGTTKQSEAWRAGMYRLAQNKLLKSVVEFEADIDAIACTLGDVIYVQHDVPEWGYGGRVVQATHNTLTVDRDVEPSEETDEVMVRVTDDFGNESIETHLVSSVDGNVITIEDSWTKTPRRDDAWAYGQQNLYARKYRVIGLEKRSDQTVKVTAIEYNDAVYDVDSVSAEIPIDGYQPPVSAGQDTPKAHPNWEDLKKRYPTYILGVPSIDQPMITNLQWNDNTPAAGYVSWSATDGTNPILLSYGGIAYEITASSSNLKYIYWDVNDTPSTFKFSDNLLDTIGAGKWLMAYNDGGTAYPAMSSKIIHGGLIQAGTVTASQIFVNGLDSNGNLDLNYIGAGDADNINEGATNKFAAESGADVTVNHQGDVQLANLGEKSVDSLDEGTTYGKMPKDWKHPSDVTFIDGGKIYTGTVTADQIAAGAVTADKISVTDLSAISADLGTIEVDTAHIADLAVDTIKIADNAVTVIEADTNPAEQVTTAGNNTDLVSVTITATGNPILIICGGISVGGRVKWRVYRDTTVLLEAPVGEGTYISLNVLKLPPIVYVDTSPGTGNRTYKLNVENVPDSTDNTTANATIVCLSLKK